MPDMAVDNDTVVCTNHRDSQPTGYCVGRSATD
jgi:hypothetical protein